MGWEKTNNKDNTMVRPELVYYWVSMQLISNAVESKSNFKYNSICRYLF